MNFPEKYRCQHPDVRNFPPTKEGDARGFFIIPNTIKLAGGFVKKTKIVCLASCETAEIPWEHVSISMKNEGLNELNRTPTWEEMCLIKNLFWSKDQNVIQFHPLESEYISHHKYVLHLWRKWGDDWETPPSITVGMKKGQDI